MKEQEKQIEEMAKDMGIAFQLSGTTRFGPVAECLVESGYQKIKKDSVVLSREDYENIYKQAEQNILANIADGGASCHWCIEQHEKKASKETAEKIYTFVNSFGTRNWERFEKFIKQFGVEIKELL
jgi:hypothetical protein